MNVKQMLCRNCFTIVDIQSLTEMCVQKQLCSRCLGRFRKEICPYCKEMRYELILISTVNELKHYLSPDNLLLDLIDKYNVYRYAEAKKICKHCLYALCSNVNKQQVLLDHLGLKINMNNQSLDNECLLEQKVQLQGHKRFEGNNIANTLHSQDSKLYEMHTQYINSDVNSKHHSMFIINTNVNNVNERSSAEEFKSVNEYKACSDELNESFVSNRDDNGMGVCSSNNNNCKEIEDKIKILSECNDIQSKNYAKISEAITKFIKEAKLENEFIQIKEQILNQDDNYHNMNISNLICFD